MNNAFPIFVLTLIIFVALPASANSEKIGDSLPITLPSLFDNKKMISSNQFKGKVLYVDFWASWCLPCRKSLPQLNELRKRLISNGKDFEVLAVNLDGKPSEALEFLNKYPVNYPVVYDATGKYPKLYGVRGMPTSYILDPQGRIQYVHSGFKNSDIKKIEALVHEMLP